MARWPATINALPPTLPTTPAGTDFASASLQMPGADAATAGDHIAGLILGEQRNMGRLRHRLDDRPALAGERHLGDRGQQAAVRHVVAGGETSGADEASDEIAIASFRGEIDRRRRTVLAAQNLAQIQALAHMGAVAADEHDGSRRRS